MRYKDKLRNTIYKEGVYNPTSGYGIIKEIDVNNYTADVIVINNSNPALGHVETNLPLPMINGVSYSMPHVGDRVLLNFPGYGESMPIIVAVYPTSIQKMSMTSIQASNLKHYDGIT
jgi:hypothetical protein